MPTADYARMGMGRNMGRAMIPDKKSMISTKIGFQQVSELLPVAGIDHVGPLPAEIQEITVFAAGISVHAARPDAAQALVEFLTAPAAASVIRKCGMEPG